MMQPPLQSDSAHPAGFFGRYFSSILLAVLVLAASLSITYLLWENEKQNAMQKLQVRFDSDVQDIGARIQQRMEGYVHVLRSAQGLFAASKSVERDEFRAFVSLFHVKEEFPGMDGICYSEIVPAAKVASHIAAVRKEGFPDYAIRPDGVRDIYTSAVYLEPFSGRNLRAFGFDNFTDPVRRDAMERARDSGKITISRKVKLLHEDNTLAQTGFRVYAPVYKNGKPAGTPEERRASIAGWIYMPLHTDEFMRHAVGDYFAKFDVEIYDGTEQSNQALMMDSDQLLRAADKFGSRFQATKRIQFLDQVWLMQVSSLPAFEVQPGDEKSRLIAVAGIISSVLAALATGLLVYGRARAEGAEALLAENNLELEERVSARTTELSKRYEELKMLNAQLQEAQEHLMQSDKMASIGQLAAGVAHEINNPIGYVHSNLGTLEKYVQDVFSMIDSYEQAEGAIADEEVRTRLQTTRKKLDIAFLKNDLHALMEESKDGITRVKNIVQNLKDFSHVDASDEWHFADLHNGIDSTLNIVYNEIKYKANVVKEYGDLPEVECLLSQLNQVFMNLLVNAAHAIEERGTITIRTGSRGDEVWVEIADTGKGIPPENMKKIFDPFFTTKPIGKGTGLGLSLSYGIIQKHHGRIEVQSEVGKGTMFRVWLPVKQPRDDSAVASSHHATPESSQTPHNLPLSGGCLRLSPDKGAEGGSRPAMCGQEKYWNGHGHD